MIKPPISRMALGVILLFATVFNGLLGTAGFALCVHELVGIDAKEETHAGGQIHCSDANSSCCDTNHGERQRNEAHCWDIDIEGELDDVVQSSQRMKASPSQAVELVAIVDLLPSIRLLSVNETCDKAASDFKAWVCATPVLVAETTVFRL
ncbi:hypothetical protein MLD52_06325 [Puniceicoccaceae bacterium K14]|nr:hypothetical protein [Puniceicoccaceae bacterium K14]